MSDVVDAELIGCGSGCSAYIPDGFLSFLNFLFYFFFFLIFYFFDIFFLYIIFITI